jgi:hypothetical protein
MPSTGLHYGASPKVQLQTATDLGPVHAAPCVWQPPAAACAFKDKVRGFEFCQRSIEQFPVDAKELPTFPLRRIHLRYP